MRIFDGTRSVLLFAVGYLVVLALAFAVVFTLARLLGEIMTDFREFLSLSGPVFGLGLL